MKVTFVHSKSGEKRSFEVADGSDLAHVRNALMSQLAGEGRGDDGTAWVMSGAGFGAVPAAERAVDVTAKARETR